MKMMINLQIKDLSDSFGKSDQTRGICRRKLKLVLSLIKRRRLKGRKRLGVF